MEEDLGSNSVIWAFAVLAIVIIVVAALYFGGAMTSKKATDVDGEINVPSR